MMVEKHVGLVPLVDIKRFFEMQEKGHGYADGNNYLMFCPHSWRKKVGFADVPIVEDFKST